MGISTTNIIILLWMCKCTHNISTKWASLIIITHTQKVFQRSSCRIWFVRGRISATLHAHVSTCVLFPPEYNQTFTLSINRNHRGFRRVVTSRGIKLELLHKGWAAHVFRVCAESSLRCRRPHGSVNKSASCELWRVRLRFIGFNPARYGFCEFIKKKGEKR